MKITSSTTLDELKDLGADTIGDIPLDELLAYVRRTCVLVAQDLIDEDEEFAVGFADAIIHIHSAIESIKPIHS